MLDIYIALDSVIDIVLMTKKIFLFLLLFSNTAYAVGCNRPSWDRCYKIINNKCIDTRHYILYRDGRDVEINNKNKVISGEWNSYYSNKAINNPKEIQIDHVLPWKFLRDNGDCKKAKEMINDEENLVIASKKENGSKSDHLDTPFETNAPYKQKQCYICKKWKLRNCKLVCN